ncbi:ABC transporter substrate-binding protein [Paenibacillus elgii]|uniref:ABC transporter substrate-binding protein n=1 Tax=Paenibacillus elgii TaxID=189691 RepID=A0A2T6FXY3_9BACL|nr:nickel ABC transporter substrate-binding protein [Paenibacillus elgii]PUA36758.1 ABC transporter substrate-binding protein [Paenibacillus elgii]
MQSTVWSAIRTKPYLYIALLCLLMAMTACRSGGNGPDGGAGESGTKAAGGAEKAGAAGEAKKLTLLYNFKSGSLDPHNGAIPLRMGVTETLVRMDEKLEVKPWLAVKWTAKDERTWVFTIRDSVTFQDGTKLDAAAVKASFERGIAASKSLASALKIASMEASGQELTVVTTEPSPSFPSELVNPSAAVISVEAEKKLGKDAFNLAPVGTGPFQVKQFKPNIEIALERYEDYWDGKAKLNEVTVKFNEDANVRVLALQSGEADIAYHIPAESVGSLEKDSRLRVESVAGLRVHFLLYNQKKPLMQDFKVRKAIDLLLNRESIAKDVMLGHAVPANGPFNSSLPFGSKDPVQKPDPAGAKKLLEEAGFQAGADGKLAKDGQPLTLELITYKGRPELPLIAQLLQSDAAAAGVTMNIKTVENVDTYLRENKDWDLATYSNSTAPRGDGGFFLNSAFMPGGALNAAGLDSPDLKDVIGRLNAAGDIGKRVQLTQEAVGVIKRELPQSYAVYPNIVVGVNKRVSNWKSGAEEYYIVTNQMDVK